MLSPYFAKNKPVYPSKMSCRFVIVIYTIFKIFGNANFRKKLMSDLTVTVRLGSIFHKLVQLLGKLPDVAVLVSEELLLVESNSVLVQ
jgi:hypothetical protein